MPYQGPGGGVARERLEQRPLTVEHVAIGAALVAVVVAIIASPVDELAVGAWLSQQQRTGGRRGLD